MRILTKSFFLPLRLMRRLNLMRQRGKKRATLEITVFCWAVSAALLMLTGAVCLVAVNGDSRAPEIIMAMAEASPLRGMALGVLGIALLRGETTKQASAGNRKKTTK